MSLDAGIYGATVQSWQGANPRDLLTKIINENPSASPERLVAILCEALKDPENEDYQAAINVAWFARDYRNMQRGGGAYSPTVTVAKAEAQKLAARMAPGIKARAERMVLLDFVLPNGKTLRDATGKDCAKAGGWLTKVAAKLKPGQVVGKVLSEADVQKLFRG